MLAVSAVPRIYVYMMSATYLLAIVMCPISTIWPAELGTLYPSRPIIQIGVACSLLPYSVYLISWALKTRSRNVIISGILKISLWVLSACITRLDEASVHGTLEFMYCAVTCYWMFTICWKKSKKTRSNVITVFLAYVFSFLWGLHQLSRFTQSGSGYILFRRLRALNVLLDLSFDYLNRDEFPGMNLNIDFCRHVHEA